MSTNAEPAQSQSTQGWLRRSSRIQARPHVNYSPYIDGLEDISDDDVTNKDDNKRSTHGLVNHPVEAASSTDDADNADGAGDADDAGDTDGTPNDGTPGDVDDTPSLSQPSTIASSSDATAATSPLRRPLEWFKETDTALPLAPKRNFDELGGDGSDQADDRGPKRPRVDAQDTLSHSVEKVDKTSDTATVDSQAIPDTANANVQSELVLHRPLAASDKVDVAEPLVWSDKRGGICEALWYYRSYRAAIYSDGDGACGFLMDQEAELRDVFSAQVVISSVGGGRQKDPDSKKMIRIGDANDDYCGYRSMKDSCKHNKAVAIIAGERHPLYPCQPPHAYAVLDWFHITDMWKEKQINIRGQAVTVWKTRLEKIDLNKSSWWEPRGHYALASLDTPATPLSTCVTCGVSSKTIFTAGWTCLNHLCDSYYLSLGNGIDINDLEYTQTFLNERTAFTGQMPALKPEISGILASKEHGTEFRKCRGFICPSCGCCSRRLFWNSLVCENQLCGRQWTAPMRPYPQYLIEEETELFLKKFKLEDDALDSEAAPDSHVTVPLAGDPLNQLPQSHKEGNKEKICQPVTEQVPILCDGRISSKLEYNSDILPPMHKFTVAGYKARVYILPDAQGNIIGSFTLFSSNDGINTAKNGPDSLFRQLEVTDIGLKRNPAAVGGHKLEGLTRHFQQNFGARYKFGVAVQSKGFDEAPEPILRALHRLIWASREAVKVTARIVAKETPNENTPPPESNEFNELLALGFMEKDRISYHDDGETELGPTVAALSLGSPSVMKFRPKLKKSGFGDRIETRSDGYKAILEVPMMHGDIMVMHGAHIHRIYEHAVQPSGGRRFSLTSRYIDPEKMKLQADKDDAAVKGKIPLDSYAYKYDGN